MKVSKPCKIKDGWAVKITRKNNSKYRATSPDYQSVVDYRNEILAEAAKKRTR